MYWLKNLLEKYLPNLEGLSDLNIDLDLKSQYLVKQETIQLHSSNSSYPFRREITEPCYLQSLTIMTKDKNSPIEFAIRDINGNRNYIRAITDNGQGAVVSAELINEQGGQVAMLKLIKYDDSDDVYTLKLDRPIYCPNGLILKLNEGNASTTASMSVAFFNEVEE